MPIIFFLEAEMPLTKTYSLDANGILKPSNYPQAYLFKSHKIECLTLKSMYEAITKHAALGHCLVKGKLKTDLDWKPRKAQTDGINPSDWLCFDLDGAPFDSPEEFMEGHPALKDVSYIVQYSASHGLGKPGLRCHIFVLLSEMFNVDYIKSWLMELNLDGSYWKGKIRQGLALTSVRGGLHWPIDITACQNDKLLYIAPAIVNKGVKYKLPPDIYLVKKKQERLDVLVLKNQQIEKWREENFRVLNALREEGGFKKISPPKIIGEYEIQKNPGRAIITQCWVDGDFIRFNLNGGDSNAYYHHINNPELIHNFKGEPSYYTKEICPDYYRNYKNKAKEEATQPTATGEIILGVCDVRSGGLWKISWNPGTQELKKFPARSEKQLIDWVLQHGKAPGDFTPQWTFEFNPLSTRLIDVDAQYLNLYSPSKFYTSFKPDGTLPETYLEKCPTIKKICASVVSNNEWNHITEHLMNWLAVLFQHRIKIQSSWLITGIEGTGKNLLVVDIIGKLLGMHHVKATTVNALEDGFNGWLEHTLLCLVNEIQVSAAPGHKNLSSKLRNWITDSPLDMRNMQQVSINAANYTNFFFASNKHDPIEIDNHDRRYNIGEYQTKRLEITGHEVEVLIPRELEYFFNYLMTREADISKARTLINTKTRRDIIDTGRNSIDILADALRDGNIAPFLEVMPDLNLINEVIGRDAAHAMAYSSIIKRELGNLLSTKPVNGIHYIDGKLTRDEILILFQYCIGAVPTGPNKFTRMLKHKGIETKKLRNHLGELCYGFEVQWTASEDWCKENTAEQKPLRRVK